MTRLCAVLLLKPFLIELPLPQPGGVPLADHGAEREAISCFAHPPGASFKRSALAGGGLERRGRKW